MTLGKPEEPQTDRLTPPPTIIPPPEGDLSDVPDKATKSGLDMTGPAAHNRILFIDFGFFKYGTDDKTHAGSIFLSLLLLLIALLVMIIGLFSAQPEWLERVLSLVWSAFMFVAGVAIGRGQSSKDD